MVALRVQGKPCWIAVVGPSGLEKRMATIHPTIRAAGEQIMPCLIIFKGRCQFFSDSFAYDSFEYAYLFKSTFFISTVLRKYFNNIKSVEQNYSRSVSTPTLFKLIQGYSSYLAYRSPLSETNSVTGHFERVR